MAETTSLPFLADALSSLRLSSFAKTAHMVYHWDSNMGLVPYSAKGFLGAPQSLNASAVHQNNRAGGNSSSFQEKIHLRLWGFYKQWLSMPPVQPPMWEHLQPSCKLANGSLIVNHHPHESWRSAACLHAQWKQSQKTAKLRQQVGDRSWHKNSTCSPFCAQRIHTPLTPK